jgi:3-methyladenine DNA glycosylase AlkD
MPPITPKLIETLTRRARKTQHGFTDLQQAAEEVARTYAVRDCLNLAKQLFASEVRQARMLAVLIFGRMAARSAPTLRFLRQKVSRDPDWRVQEILAQAFDRYCADIGYESALPVIEDWLSDPQPNVRRAAAEGLRIWTSRDYFRDHPLVAVRLLSRLKGDESQYVRKSSGNALRDISRKHAPLIRAELATWDLSDRRIAQTHRLAARYLKARA